MRARFEELLRTGEFEDQEMVEWLTSTDEDLISDLRRAAREVQHTYYKNHIFIRGLIEFTNYCRQDCYYCGIRRSNHKVTRYRLTENEINACVDLGYELGFRTFVFQGGEDAHYTVDFFVRLIRRIKEKYPDCAVTLSEGVRSYDFYQAIREAGCDRYLLRHETIDEDHFKSLHPPEQSLQKRVEALFQLKELGYHTGSGIMVGSPGQTIDMVVRDLRFLQRLKPEMIGIGPFLPQSNTPFGSAHEGSYELTLRLISVMRLLFPTCLIPATTALGTIRENGREEGILCGANVVMPNLSPPSHRKDYALYDNKIATGAESAEKLDLLKERMREIGYQVVVDRGDPASNGGKNVR